MDFRIIVLEKTLEITPKPLVYVQHCKEIDPLKLVRLCHSCSETPRGIPLPSEVSSKPLPQGIYRFPALLVPDPCSLTMLLSLLFLEQAKHAPPCGLYISCFLGTLFPQDTCMAYFLVSFSFNVTTLFPTAHPHTSLALPLTYFSPFCCTRYIQHAVYLFIYFLISL